MVIQLVTCEAFIQRQRKVSNVHEYLLLRVRLIFDCFNPLRLTISY